MNPAGSPHSDTLESQLGCQLLEAYRRLLRPSSAPGAKASTVCPYKLTNPQLDNPPHPTNQHHNQPADTMQQIRPQNTTDARVHYAVLKQRPDPTRHPAPTPTRPTPTTGDT